MTESKEARYFRERVEAIRNGERGGSPEDRKTLLTLAERLEREPGTRGDDRRWDVLQQTCIMAEEVGGIHRITDDHDAVDDILDWINWAFAQPDGERLRPTTTTWNTWGDYRSSLLTAGQLLNRGKEPETLRNVSSDPPKGGRTTNRSSDKDLPGPEVIKRRMNVRPNPHGRAIIGSAFATGIRPKAALWKLLYGDVEAHDKGIVVRVYQDKIEKFIPDGGREVMVFWEPAVEAINAWLQFHPTQDPDDPLWMTQNTDGRMTYRRFADIFREAAEESKTTNYAVTPKKYQRANRDWLIDTIGMKPEVVAWRQGRSPDSRHKERYEAQRSADRQLELYHKATGKPLDVQDQPTDDDFEDRVRDIVEDMLQEDYTPPRPFSGIRDGLDNNTPTGRNGQTTQRPGEMSGALNDRTGFPEPDD